MKLNCIYPYKSVSQKKLLENLHPTLQKSLVNKTMILVSKQIEVNQLKNLAILKLKWPKITSPCGGVAKNAFRNIEKKSNRNIITTNGTFLYLSLP